MFQDKKNGNFYQVGVLSSSPNQPFYYFGTSAMGLVIFDKYENSVPPESVFDLPASCKSIIPPANTNNKVTRNKHLNVFNQK